VIRVADDRRARLMSTPDGPATASKFLVRFALVLKKLLFAGFVLLQHSASTSSRLFHLFQNLAQIL
jgi:hypothetical protein